MDLETLWEAVDPEPDPLLLYALADAYEEADRRHVADLLRWAARHGKRPYKGRHFQWYSEEEMRRALCYTDPASNVPDAWLQKTDPLTHYKHDRLERTDHSTMRDAFLALAEGRRLCEEKCP